MRYDIIIARVICVSLNENTKDMNFLINSFIARYLPQPTTSIPTYNVLGFRYDKKQYGE